MVGFIAALWLANLTMHLDVLGVLPGWRARGAAVGLDVVVFLILVVAGRTFPMFTKSRRIPVNPVNRRSPAQIERAFLRSMNSRNMHAGLRATGALHVLRHTFCAHLAKRGAPAKAIQELAGHANLSTTLRYMHLSPSARSSAIGLLNARPVEGADFGDIVEPRVTADRKL